MPRFTLKEPHETKRPPWHWIIYLPWANNWVYIEKHLERRLPELSRVLMLRHGLYWMVLVKLNSLQVLWTCNVSDPPRYLVCGRATLALLLGRLRALDTPELPESSRAALRTFVDEGAHML